MKGKITTKWILDSGCTKHMTGDPSLFSTFSRKKNGGTVTFGGNAKGRILGKGNIGMDSKTLIENTILVDTLQCNLLSISQLCDKGYKVVFDCSKCFVESKHDGQIVFEETRVSNIYIIDITCALHHEKCFSALEDNAWLWHRRLGHINMELISKISKKDLVKGIPKIRFEKDKVCDACQFGKQIKTSFKDKIYISTSKPLQLIHMDLFGPSRVANLGGKFYIFVLVDDFSRFTWVIFLT